MNVPLAVAVVGAIVYLVASNVKNPPGGLAELGRLAFGIGLFVYLFK